MDSRYVGYRGFMQSVGLFNLSLALKKCCNISICLFGNERGRKELYFASFFLQLVSSGIYRKLKGETDKEYEE